MHPYIVPILLEKHPSKADLPFQSEAATTMRKRMKDYSVDKELAGWSHSKSCGQWLDVQVETNDKWHSSVVCIGTGAI